MLLVGMDVSGDERHSNYKYLGIVIGTNENILGLSDSIGPLPEHMSQISVQERDYLIGKLVFDSKNRIAFCVALNRQEIIDQIMQLRQSRQKRLGKETIYADLQNQSNTPYVAVTFFRNGYELVLYGWGFERTLDLVFDNFYKNVNRSMLEKTWELERI